MKEKNKTRQYFKTDTVSLVLVALSSFTCWWCSRCCPRRRRCCCCFCYRRRLLLRRQQRKQQKRAPPPPDPPRRLLAPRAPNTEQPRAASSVPSRTGIPPGIPGRWRSGRRWRAVPKRPFLSKEQKRKKNSRLLLLLLLLLPSCPFLLLARCPWPCLQQTASASSPWRSVPSGARPSRPR